MGALDSLWVGFAAALSLDNLLFCFVGVLIGTLVGVLPGIGALAAVAMLIPVTLHLPPDAALIMMAGVYYGGEYGGSISSILLNVPGTPSAAITCLDGHPMARQGRAGAALLLTALSSFVGGVLGVVALIVLAPALVKLALSVGPAEYFAVMVFGLVAASVINKGAPRKGLAMMLLGLLLATVGTDIDSGVRRFSGGITELYDGIGIIVVAMGLFGVTEVIAMMHGPVAGHFYRDGVMQGLRPTRSEWRQSGWPSLRGSGIGAICGALPGAGPTIASIAAYAAEKRISRRPDTFGQGAVAGLVAPEAANNAAAQAAFVPTLSLGIPGSATMAVMLGVLLIHGITPGPQMITVHGDVFWTLVASFVVGNLLLLVLNIPLIGVWVRLLKIPPQYLYPMILCMICISVFSINQSIVSVLATLGMGVLGYGLKLGGFHLTPVLVGYVLGPLIEENLRRALAISQGDFAVLIASPLSLGMLLATAIVLVGSGLWGQCRYAKRIRKK